MNPVPRALVLGLVTTCAQLPAQQLVDVYVGTEGENVWSMPPYRRGVAVARDGSIWVLMARSTQAGNRRQRQLLLVGSKDGGRSFAAPIDLPTHEDSLGSIVADLRDPRLHVSWEAGNGRGHHSVFYQIFDCALGKFVGERQCVLPSKSGNHQYYSSDLEFTHGGDLAMTVFTHRSPDRKVWPGGWAGGLMLLPAGGDQWSKPKQLNIGFSGLQSGLQVLGGDLCMTYRSFGSAAKFGLDHRAFDTKAARWRQPQDVAVRVTRNGPAGEVQPGNTGCLASDFVGNLYVMYTEGTPGHKKRQVPGRLCVAFAARPKNGAAPQWRHLDLAEDRVLVGGNKNPVHFALTRGPGNQVVALYSLQTEQHRFLYRQVLDAGQVVGRRQRIASDRVGAFAGVNGLRSVHFDTTLLGVVHGETTRARHGRVAAVVTNLPVRTFWRKRQ